MGVMNGYYNKMPDVDTKTEISNLFRGGIGVEDLPHVNYDETLMMIQNREYGAVRRGHTLEIKCNMIPWVNM